MNKEKFNAEFFSLAQEANKTQIPFFAIYSHPDTDDSFFFGSVDKKSVQMIATLLLQNERARAIIGKAIQVANENS